MSVNLYNKLNSESGYKLLQLPNDLIEAFEKGSVKFKSLSNENSDVVLCSQDKTWLLKQRNHSNTVMLLREFAPDVGGEAAAANKINTFGLPSPTADWAGFSTLDSELEPKLVSGSIDVTQLDIYDGTDASLTRKLSLEEFKNMCPCSEKEFAEKWIDVAGCLVDGSACLLSERFILKALHIILITCMAESFDIDELRIDNVVDALQKDTTDGKPNVYTKNVITTVIRKFSSPVAPAEELFKINMPLVAKWYGVSALKIYASKEPLSEQEFMVQWKAQFPPYFHCDLDICMLRGYFVRPLKDKIRYISKDTLSPDPKERFKQLFHWQSVWELDDMLPYTEELNTKKLKPDVFVMKYARRKRVGNKFIISAR